jgi:hypothetical protein
MSGLRYIDLLIGMSVFFLVTSTICWILIELPAGWLGWRRKHLQKWLSSLLVTPDGASGRDDPLLDFVSSALFKSLAPSTNVNAWRGDEDAQGPSYLGTDDFIAIAMETQFGKPVTSYTQLKRWQIEQEEQGENPAGGIQRR